MSCAIEFGLVYGTSQAYKYGRLKSRVDEPDDVSQGRYLRLHYNELIRRSSRRRSFVIRINPLINTSTGSWLITQSRLQLNV